MEARLIERYGIEFPDGTPEATMALAGYSKSIVLEEDRGDRAKIMLECIRLLWSENVFRISLWTERRVRTFCSESFFTMWGPSSAGKTTDMAAIVLIHWLSAPHFTTCTVCSTTRPSLTQRIFGEIVRLYKSLDNPPGEYKKAQTAIILGDDNSKNGIFGVAVLIGTVDEAMGNMIGKHNRRNVLVVDEMQATREAAVAAVSNLQGGEDFHFVGIGNPTSRTDPLGRYSEPVGGWGSINMGMEEWPTKWGKCLFFDGRKSPAIKEPHKYPYLLKKADIEQRIKWYGENSPRYWSQTIGFIPPEGLLRTLFAESFFVKYHCKEKVVWANGYKTLSSLDPAFALGGDRCVQRFARFGKDTTGTFVIEFQEPIIIPLEMSEAEPMNFMTARKVKENCLAHGVDPQDFGMDISGTQTALADIIESEWARGIMRVQFGGAPTNLPISMEENVTAKERYANRVTELWQTFYQFGRYGHIRGLDDDTIREFCSRELLEKLNPVCIEPKSLMKVRTERSPDFADAAVIMTALVRERLGITPGYGSRSASNSETFDATGVDIDDPNKMYLTKPEEYYSCLAS